MQIEWPGLVEPLRSKHFSGVVPVPSAPFAFPGAGSTPAGDGSLVVKAAQAMAAALRTLHGAGWRHVWIDGAIVTVDDLHPYEQADFEKAMRWAVTHAAAIYNPMNGFSGKLRRPSRACRLPPRLRRRGGERRRPLSRQQIPPPPPRCGVRPSPRRRLGRSA